MILELDDLAASPETTTAQLKIMLSSLPVNVTVGGENCGTASTREELKELILTHATSLALHFPNE